MSKKPKAKAQKPKTKQPVIYADEKRIAKLEQIKAKLEAGKHVQNRDLQTWLTRDEFNAIDVQWAEELERRDDMYGQKPDCITEYEMRLNKIIFKNNRANDYSRKGKAKTSTKLVNDVDAEMEALLEWLSETYYEDKSIASWFDRDVSNALEIGANLDLDAMPRIVTSRSLSNERGVRKRSIAEIKLLVVNNALENLKHPVSDDATSTKKSGALKTLLNLPFENE